RARAQHAQSTDSDDDCAREPFPRKRKKSSLPDDTRWSTGESTSTWATTHLVWPQVLLGYIRLGFSLFMMGLSIYFIVQLVWTVHHDLEMKAFEFSAEIAQQVSECSKSYIDNRCDPPSERLPAVQALCAEWELCMVRDPREVGRLQVGAETIAEILNKLIEPMTYKTMVFGSVLFFGTLFLWLTSPSLSSLRVAPPGGAAVAAAGAWPWSSRTVPPASARFHPDSGVLPNAGSLQLGAGGLALGNAPHHPFGHPTSLAALAAAAATAPQQHHHYYGAVQQSPSGQPLTMFPAETWAKTTPRFGRIQNKHTHDDQSDLESDDETATKPFSFTKNI
ncbi:hypothetical protein HK405_014825, partial [Cladochytrium tenue]